MAFIFPMIIMAFMKIFLTFRLLYKAYGFLKGKKILLKQFQLYEGEFPDELRSARYQFQNMFEIPILFYILCLINMYLDFSYTSDLVFVWGFVIFRIIHFFFRLKNQRDLNIRPRTLAFLLSLIFLSLGWSSLLFNVISRYI